jgi:hypothetical protein
LLGLVSNLNPRNLKVSTIPQQTSNCPMSISSNHIDRKHFLSKFRFSSTGDLTVAKLRLIKRPGGSASFFPTGRFVACLRVVCR